MKPYLVDVPVKINIWIRPECQKRQFDIIRQARPSILFVTSDGGRNEKEWEIIRENRRLYDEGIDWECKVYKLYMDENLGLYAMGKKRSELIWNTVDRCILLEDDILPSVSFFQYCAELLEKYKDDLRINAICGMNHLGVYEKPSADYFFAKQGSIWGVATWKRSYEMRDREFSYGKDPYTMELLRKSAAKNPSVLKRIEAYAKQEYYEGHVAASEFYIDFAMYGENQVQIIPKKNLINNIGCTEDSIHFDSFEKLPPWRKCVFNMKTYELDFPLKHPRFVIPDEEYVKRREDIMMQNHLRKAQIKLYLYRLKTGDFKFFADLVRNKLSGKKSGVKYEK